MSRASRLRSSTMDSSAMRARYRFSSTAAAAMAIASATPSANISRSPSCSASPARPGGDNADPATASPTQLTPTHTLTLRPNTK